LDGANVDEKKKKISDKEAKKRMDGSSFTFVAGAACETPG
jgi:hypothetical protein